MASGQPPKNPKPWDRYVGERIRTLRTDRGFTQEQLAEEVRRLWGLPWSRPTLTAVESGNRELSARELFALTDVLLVSPQELLEGLQGERMGNRMAHRMGTWLQVGPRSSVNLAAVLRAMEPGRRRQVLDGRDTPATNASAEQIAGMPELRRQLKAARINPTPEVLTQIAQAERGEAEKKAAAILGLDPRRVAVLSLKLWGRSLTAEREARFAQHEPDATGSGSLRTLRGHITRGLIAELRAVAGGTQR
jgi:transcriptional regulator with XRE-family HTH domain